jgi:hypothetical protein
MAWPAAGCHPSRHAGSAGRLRLGPGPSGPGSGWRPSRVPGRSGRGETRGSAFGRLTRPAGQAGPLDESATIGTRSGWADRLRERGYALRGHRLVRRRQGDGSVET